MSKERIPAQEKMQQEIRCAKLPHNRPMPGEYAPNLPKTANFGIGPDVSGHICPCAEREKDARGKEKEK